MEPQQGSALRDPEPSAAVVSNDSDASARNSQIRRMNLFTDWSGPLSEPFPDGLGRAGGVGRGISVSLVPMMARRTFRGPEEPSSLRAGLATKKCARHELH